VLYSASSIRAHRIACQTAWQFAESGRRLVVDWAVGELQRAKKYPPWRAGDTKTPRQLPACLQTDFDNHLASPTTAASKRIESSENHPSNTVT